jgi:hypothetical protein
MSDEILLQFLAAGIVNVGSDDSKLEKLRATAKDLAATLKKTPTRTVRWTLIAIDPEASAEDPVIAESWATLKKHWATVSNSYQSTPILLLRATLLDALVQSASKDEAIAVAFANSARNMLPYMPLGAEGPVWQRAVAEIEDIVDARAQVEWMTPELIQVAPMDYVPPGKVAISSGDKVTHRGSMNAKVLAAAGPTGGEDHNPYWPHSSPSQWAPEFSKRLAVAIADGIDSVSKANKIESVDLSPPLKALASAVDQHVAEALTAFSGATAGLQRRTNLLWWKEALYSTSTRTSYRSMEPFMAASLMALDLLEQVPIFSPASVSAFLNETILLLPRASAAEPLSIPKIVDRLLQDPVSRSLRDAARKLEPSWEGRSPLLTVLGHFTHETVGSIVFRRATGFDNHVEMRPDDWGAHLFRELQAARATQLNVSKRARNKG